MIDGNTGIATWLGGERKMRLATCATNGGARTPPTCGFVGFVDTANLHPVSR